MIKEKNEDEHDGPVADVVASAADNRIAISSGGYNTEWEHTVLSHTKKRASSKCVYQSFEINRLLKKRKFCFTLFRL